jgi:hypothetical protein
LTDATALLVRQAELLIAVKIVRVLAVHVGWRGAARLVKKQHENEAGHCPQDEVWLGIVFVVVLCDLLRAPLDFNFEKPRVNMVDHGF